MLHNFDSCVNYLTCLSTNSIKEFTKLFNPQYKQGVTFEQDVELLTSECSEDQQRSPEIVELDSSITKSPTAPKEQEEVACFGDRVSCYLKRQSSINAF